MLKHSRQVALLASLMLVGCVSPAGKENKPLSLLTEEAFNEYLGFRQHKAFAVGQSGDYQVWGYSYGWTTERQAADRALNECRKQYRIQIGGPDNCVIYALDTRLCEQVCLY